MFQSLVTADVEPIRVVLVEDDELFALGLTTALQQLGPAIALVGSASNGVEAIAQVVALSPAVVLMDLGLPLLDGISATRQIKRAHPQTKVIALTSHAEPEWVEALLKSGVDGYCLKGLSMERLAIAIEQVSGGVLWLDGPVAAQAQRLFQQPVWQDPAGTAELAALTDREREVLHCLAQGKTNTEIAAELVISAGTVRVHVHAILRKLQVSDRTQAAIVYLTRLPNV